MILGTLMLSRKPACISTCLEWNHCNQGYVINRGHYTMELHSSSKITRPQMSSWFTVWVKENRYFFGCSWQPTFWVPNQFILGWNLTGSNRFKISCTKPEKSLFHVGGKGETVLRDTGGLISFHLAKSSHYMGPSSPATVSLTVDCSVTVSVHFSFPIFCIFFLPVFSLATDGICSRLCSWCVCDTQLPPGSDNKSQVCLIESQWFGLTWNYIGR